MEKNVSKCDREIPKCIIKQPKVKIKNKIIFELNELIERKWLVEPSHLK